MFNWLRKRIGSKLPWTHTQARTSAPDDQKVKTGGANIQSQTDTKPKPIKELPPVLVRGEYWWNTAELKREIPPLQEAATETSLEGLIKQLGRVDRAEARRAAAESLGRMGPAALPALPALLNSTVDVDASVREAALNAVQALDPDWPKNPDARQAFPGLIEALDSRYQDVSQVAIRLLHLYGPQAIPELAQALASGEDTGGKVCIMHLLGRIGPQAACAVPELTRALSSSSVPIRIAAAATLGKIGPLAKTAIPALTAGLSDQYSGVRQAMATSLARFGAASGSALPYLLPLLADRQSNVREAASAVLENIGPQTVPALIEVLQARDLQRFKAWLTSMDRASHWFTQPNPDIYITEPQKYIDNVYWQAYDIFKERACLEAAQQAALRLLGRFGPAAVAALPAVTQALTDPNPAIRLAAIEALLQIGPDAQKVTPDLVRLLLDKNATVREAAAHALEIINRDWISHPVVAAALVKLAGLLSNEGEPGENAVSIFTRLGVAVVPMLIDALGSVEPVTRGNAAIALGQIGAGAQAAIPALTGALQDNDSRVRDEAARALAKIQVQ